METPENITPEDLERRRKFFEQLKPFVLEFTKESDRASVILGAAKLDSLLYQLLERTLLPCGTGEDELLDGERPLSTFSARINVLLRLGVIDESIARTLHLVRKIRNAFAHEVETSSFAPGPHADRVNALVACFPKEGVYSQLRKVPELNKCELISGDFRAAIILLCTILNVAVFDAHQIRANLLASMKNFIWRFPEEGL